MVRGTLLWSIFTFVTGKAGLIKGVVFHKGGLTLSNRVPLYSSIALI